MVERRQALMGCPAPSEFLPLARGLAPRLDGKQNDENDGEKNTVAM